MKYRSSLAVVLLGLILSSTTVVSAKEYSDVEDTSSYYKAVAEFSNRGILEGYPDGTFKPAKAISRAEALKVILKAFNKELNPTIDPSKLKKFSDTDSKEWYFQYIQPALHYGIIEGYQDGTFKPANQVLFSEALKMGLVTKGITTDELEYKNYHPSIKETDWFAKYFSYGLEKLIIELEPNGALNPIKEYTRGEFVELIYRLVETPNEGVFDVSYNWNQDTINSGLNISYPLDWERFTLGDGVFLGYFAGNKPSFITTVTNGARVSINYFQNSENKSEQVYFDELKLKLKQQYPNAEIEFNDVSTEIGSALTVKIANLGLINHYIYLEDNNILIAEGSYDYDSLKAPELINEINLVFDKIGTTNGLLLSPKQKLEVARINILVRGKGQEILDLFIQKELIETDTLGVGTGPVDYYYVPGVNHTIKYERTTNTIWDIKEGKTTAF
jgi:hypothetical protein